MKIIISFSVLFFLILTVKVFAQFETIQEFPREYPTQDIRELTPVWISENEVLAFYTTSTLDTIFSRRTTNQGQSWSEQKVEQIYTWSSPPYWTEKLFIAAIKGHNNRLLLSWKGKIIYSDDNGLTWSESTMNNTLYYAKYSSFKKLDNNRILFSSILSGRGYIISLDNGETWLPENFVYLPGHPNFPPAGGDFSVAVLSEDSLIMVTAGRSSFSSSVYSLTSTDGGESWGDTTWLMDIHPIFDFHAYTIWLHGPKICLETDSEKNVFLFFDQSFDTGYDSIKQHDVGVWKTSDFGNTWTKEENFTKYLGYDLLENVSVLDGKFLVTFITYRKSESSQNLLGKQNYFGVYGRSEDAFTPPVVLSQKVTDVNYQTDEFDYRALVVDDEAVAQVYVNLENGGYQSEMFDDGMHNDSLANDKIYGNTFPVLTPSSIIPYYDNSYAVDVSKINLPLNNRGILADVDYTHLRLIAEFNMEDINGNLKKEEEIAEIPVQNPGHGGKYDEGVFLYSGGFFLSGYSNGEMWSNAVASASLVEDYTAGKIGSDPQDKINRIYVVNKKDKPFGYSWQSWKNAVSLGAEFYDGDGDGIYNPVDKNWNGTWDINEDMPPLIGDEIAWCVYNDGQPANQRRWQSEPQGIEVRQTIFATNDPELENVIFIRYSIHNTGTVAEVMDSVYFGIWDDGDLGDPTDDVIGCDTLLNSGFYYGNEPDAQYGNNPPSFFSAMLQSPVVYTNNPSDTANNNFGELLGTQTISKSKNLDITAHTFFIGGNPNLRDPNSATEARNYLLGENRIGEYPNPCTWPFGQVRGGIDCHQVNPHFWFSGDPVADIGWISTQNRDTRNLISTGPFNLGKDKPQEIIIAYVIGRGTDPINSVTVARENVQRAIQEYESNFASMTYSAAPATNPVRSYILYQNYPNPFNPITTIRYELPQDGVVTIDIYDILGQKVKTILNEFKKADRYEVTFNSTGLASGVYIYQMRVNDFITCKKMVLVK
ncbi:MAG: T9SS type A sorting domain-containing protein [Chlorobium sp.]|nr:T9SS type A sorting domain-containing protein [Chlorobium sp.]